MTTDAIRTEFLGMVSRGLSHAEALAEFDLEQLQQAALRDMLQRPGEAVSDDTSLFRLMCIAQREEMNAQDMEKAVELWLAGWTSETPSRTQVDVMSWYWRRPPRRKGRPGRRFLSTNQAWMAMRREAK